VELSHIDPQTGDASMVDVSAKPATARRAVAQAQVRMRPDTLRLLQAGALAKGDAFSVARIAGIMAAKRTPDLIPLCHTLPLGSVKIEFDVDATESTVTIFATATAFASTGVEMEALTAATVAALTLYDMAKSSDPAMEIGAIHLVSKTGGKRGDFTWKASEPSDT
jgi:cyclic pyranopterin phosphate synthase